MQREAGASTCTVISSTMPCAAMQVYISFIPYFVLLYYSCKSNSHAQLCSLVQLTVPEIAQMHNAPYLGLIRDVIQSGALRVQLAGETGSGVDGTWLSDRSYLEIFTREFIIDPRRPRTRFICVAKPHARSRNYCMWK